MRTKGYVVDMEQIEPSARLALRREVRSGRVQRVRAPIAGLMGIKTHYVVDRDGFDRAQAAARADLRLAIALDECARASKARHMDKARATRPVEEEGTVS